MCGGVSLSPCRFVSPTPAHSCPGHAPALERRGAEERRGCPSPASGSTRAFPPVGGCWGEVGVLGGGWGVSASRVLLPQNLYSWEVCCFYFRWFRVLRSFVEVKDTEFSGEKI